MAVSTEQCHSSVPTHRLDVRAGNVDGQSISQLIWPVRHRSILLATGSTTRKFLRRHVRRYLRTLAERGALKIVVIGRR